MNIGEDQGIQQRMKEREERKSKRAAAKTKAQELWKSMDHNARTGVRFGMFPAELMRAAESEGLDMHDVSQALMDCAEADGGMRA
jgi:hypothetical protein